MSYDEFFTDGDKPYAENLNDSLLLMDAFDVTVPCEMPGMFNNGEFSSTVEVPRKAGIAIVTLKSVDEGVTVGTDSISGTGDVVFRIYPNFNSFYKWYSIVLEKTGTVSVAFKKTDGTSISATVGNEGVISEASALKELQEIDVIFTLTSATITNILINFRNNQSTRTRTGALLEAGQLTNVNDTITSGDTGVVSGGAIYDEFSSVNSSLSDLEANKSDIDHTHTVSDVTDWLNKVYPIGAIYMSVNSTNPSILFGGTWEKIENTFLLAAGSSYTAGTTGGSADAVVVSHTHIQYAHNHTQNGHTHTQNSHNHTQNAHNHPISGNWSDGEGSGHAWAYSTGRKVSSKSTEYATATNKAATATNQATTATNNEATAINQPTGVDGTGKNMPPYMTVYMWKRTA